MTRIQGAIGLAACGGLATSPFVVGIVGWADHWNAYINLLLMLGTFPLWFTIIYAANEAMKASE